MSLRWRIQWLFAALLITFTAAFAVLQIVNTRRSVQEEITGAAQVAARLLARIGSTYAATGPDGMRDFLQQLGRVRAHDLRLLDSAGHELYHSPASTYKPGRQAPHWYAEMVSPQLETREIPIGTGRLVIRPDASRAVLDGWDELGHALLIAAAALALSSLLLMALAARALQPLAQIADGLAAMERGNYDVRLLPMATRELNRIGQSFNRMAAAVADSVHVRASEARARAELAENRALTGLIQRRIEQERGAIARELHDELGQQVTAIKSLGLLIARRTQGPDPQSEQAARLVMTTADQIYDVLHLMIPRLRPLALDRFGLADALDDMVADWRAQHPQMRFDIRTMDLHDALPEPIATAAYRIVQEAGNNAIRHAAATRVAIAVGVAATDRGDAVFDARNGNPAVAGNCLRVAVEDNGCGLPENWARAGHFGLLGMRERAELLGGRLQLQRPVSGGLEVVARLPLPNAEDADGPAADRVDLANEARP